MFRKGGNSSCFLLDKTRKIHTTFPGQQAAYVSQPRGARELPLLPASPVSAIHCCCLAKLGRLSLELKTYVCVLQMALS